MSDFCGQGIELSAEKAKCNKTLSSASPWPQTNVIQCDRCRGNPRKGDGMDNCVEKWLCFSLLLFLPPSALGTAGCPAGEEGCQGLVCPPLAWGEPPTRTAEAGDTTGDRALGSGTSDRVASGLPTSPPLRWRFLPVPGDLYHRVLANAVGPDPHWM